MIPQHIKDTIMSEDTCNRLMNEFVHVIKSEIRRIESSLYDVIQSSESIKRKEIDIEELNKMIEFIKSEDLYDAMDLTTFYKIDG